jgi:hypothetical protein
MVYAFPLGILKPRINVGPEHTPHREPRSIIAFCENLISKGNPINVFHYDVNPAVIEPTCAINPYNPVACQQRKLLCFSERLCCTVFPRTIKAWWPYLDGNSPLEQEFLTPKNEPVLARSQLSVKPNVID